MGTLARLLFILAMIVGPVVVFATSGVLPDRVATHFGAGGGANGWMSRQGYLWFMSVFVVIVPLVVVLISGFIPHSARPFRLAARGHADMKDGAADPQILAWRRGHACWLGCIMVVFLTAMHLMLIEANEHVPARLAEAPFFVLLGLFVLATIVWSFALRSYLRSRQG